MSTPFCVSPPNLAHRTKKHRKTCSKHRSPSLTSRPPSHDRTLDKTSVGGDAHAVERSGTSTLGVHRPVCHGSAAASSLPCVKAAQCSHWVVRSEAKLRCQRSALTEGLSISGWTEPSAPTHSLPIAFAPSVRADVGIRPYEITGGVCVIRTGGQSRPPLHTVSRRQKYFQPAAKGRHLPLPLRGKGAI